MLCQFQVYSKVIQLYIYIQPLFFRFFSHIGYYRILSRVPCAIQEVLADYLFYRQQCVSVNSVLLIYPSPLVTINLFPVSESVSVLYIDSFVLFFRLLSFNTFLAAVPGGPGKKGRERERSSQRRSRDEKQKEKENS